MKTSQESADNTGDLEFGTEVADFWGLTGDPITPKPLNFRNPVHFEYFVKTRTINALKDVRRQFLNDSDSRILLLLGNRGTGKTTAMKYLSSLIKKENKQMAFIDCNINADISDFTKSVHLSIFKGFRHFLLKEKKLPGEIINQMSNVNSGNHVDEIDDKIELLLDMICEDQSYEKKIIFFDNLDKTKATNLFDIVQGYFRSQQGIYEKFLDYDNIYLFISLIPVFKDLLTDPEVNFLAGKVIKVRDWTESELDELLCRRLGMAYSRSKEFRLDNFLLPNARRLIYVNNEYNPRWSLLAVKRLLKRYYEVYTSVKKKHNKNVAEENVNESSEIIDVNKSPVINEHFCRLYYHEMQGAKRGLPAAKIDFETLDTSARNRFKNAYDKTKGVMEQFKDFRLEIVEAMVSVYVHEDILDDQASLNKLSETGLVQIAQGRYNFTPDVLKLFNYLYDNVHKNTSYLRHYLLKFML